MHAEHCSVGQTIRVELQDGALDAKVQSAKIGRTSQDDGEKEADI